MSFPKKFLAAFRRRRYPGSAAYWESRYAAGGDSGSGSGGVLAQYKALVVNEITWKNDIQSVVELGCGDGRQLELTDFPRYLGLDISPAAVARCREKFEHDRSKKFRVYDPSNFEPGTAAADLALSLEVVFHLTEQPVYEAYLRHLFASARRLVVIFSSDEADWTGGIYPHFQPRHFSPDLERLAPGWSLREKIQNPHWTLSRSDFFVFEKRG